MKKTERYHYTECGLQNVWLANGFVFHDTPYGRGVSIRDVEGLHRAIGKVLAHKPRLTGAELRFLRKEMKLSQSAMAPLLGTSEQNISLWERRGHVPKASDRLARLLYLENLGNQPQIRALIDRLIELDRDGHDQLAFAEHEGQWREAA